MSFKDKRQIIGGGKFGVGLKGEPVMSFGFLIALFSDERVVKWFL